MKSAKLIICVVSAMFAAINPARAQALLAGDVPTRVENFIRAECNLCFSGYLAAPHAASLATDPRDLLSH